MLSFIGMIIAGAVLGALARLVMRGEQNISVLWTIVLGAVGALVGGAVASLFGVAHTDGIDWIRWALSLVAAIVAISVYLGVPARKKPSPPVMGVGGRPPPPPHTPLRLL